MKHIQHNEIRIRETDNSYYYVFGETVRSQLIAMADSLREMVDLNHAPEGYNANDNNVLRSMDVWLKEERDFNSKQWLKFGKMLTKFGLPNTIKELGKELGWTIGKKLQRSEMAEIMQERRDNVANEKAKLNDVISAKGYAHTTAFNALFSQE